MNHPKSKPFDAKALGRKGGLKGGNARADKHTTRRLRLGGAVNQLSWGVHLYSEF